MPFKNVGTFDLGMVGQNGANKAVAMDANGIASAK